MTVVTPSQKDPSDEIFVKKLMIYASMMCIAIVIMFGILFLTSCQYMPAFMHGLIVAEEDIIKEEEAKQKPVEVTVNIQQPEEKHATDQVSQ